MSRNSKLVELILENAEQDGHCQVWNGECDPDGRPSIEVLGQHLPIARLLLGEQNGSDIADDLVIEHRCGNPACVNVTHLLALTPEHHARQMLSSVSPETQLRIMNELAEELGKVII